MRSGWGSIPALTLIALLWNLDAHGATHRKGDHVLFSGQVIGSDGEPVPNVTVLLELSRTSFSIRRFKQVKKNTLRIPVTATVDGRYLHDWRWDGYYNTFGLAVAVPVATGATSGQDVAGATSGQDGVGAPSGRPSDHDGFEILYRIDVTERVRQGVAAEGGTRDIVVVTPLVVEETGDLGWLRGLLDGSAGAEESRIFREMGRPDRIDSHEGGATAWWYFEAGKVYRFRDGALEQVEHFEPIKPL